MRLVDLTIPGDPMPKERPRLGKAGHTYTPAKTRTAEQVLRWLLERQRNECWPVTEPVGIAVEFYCATRHRKDGDNLLKLLTDAMNSVVYKDDSQIEEWYCRIHRGVGKERSRTELFLYTLGEDS